MRRFRPRTFGTICAIVLVGATAAVAPAATPPTAIATQAFVAGSPSTIGCDGWVDETVTITGQAGTIGQSTDVVLALDVSGSIGSPASKLAQLKQSAIDALAALDAADGTTDQAISGNAVGLVYYHGTTATLAAPIGSSYSTLLSTIDTLPTPSGGTPQAAGFDVASAALAASTDGFAKAMVVVTDGQASGSDLTAATDAATRARSSGVRIVPFGIGSDVDKANLTTWSSQASYYQAATPGPIDRAKLVSDLGAARLAPVAFTLSEALGSTFSAAPLSSSTGTVTTAAGGLQWTGTLTGSQSATLTYRATRNGSDVFGATSEPVNTASLVAAGGSAVVAAPAMLSIGVLPCGSTPLASTTCTGASCTVSGSQAGQQYTVDAGAAPAGTSVVLSGVSVAPPAGVCPGFDSTTTGAEFDIQPFTRDATFRYVLPRASLGRTRWWQTNICLGTNLRFTTAITSFANLRPGARFVGGGTLPGRWWGLLPSIPRTTYIPGLGFVRGPWITSRSLTRTGDAVIMVLVPFVPGSAASTTDGRPGYDPKLWG